MFNPWMIVGILLFGAACFTGGIHVESDHRDAQLLTQAKADQEAYVQRTNTLKGNADQISAELNELKEKHAGERLKFKHDLQEAKDANQLDQCKVVPAANGKPATTVHSVNVGLWDSALKVPAGPGGDSGGVDAAAGGPSFAPIERAYDNLEENGSRWQHCRDQVRGWQALAIKNGWVTKPPDKVPQSKSAPTRGSK